MDPNLKRKLIVGIISTIIVIGMMCISQLIRRKQRTFMRELADTLGLKIDGGGRIYPKIALLAWARRPLLVHGLTSGHFVAFQHIQKGRSTYHGFSMALKGGKGLRVFIQGTGLLGKLTIISGVKLISTGDKLFDSQISIRSNNPNLATAIFSTAEVKNTLLETWKNEKPSDRIEIEDEVIRYRRGGGLSSAKRLRHMTAMIRTAALLADALDAASAVTRKTDARRQ